MLDSEKLIQEIIVFTQTLRVDVKSGDIPVDVVDLMDMRDAMNDCLDIIQVIIDVRSIE